MPTGRRLSARLAAALLITTTVLLILPSSARADSSTTFTAYPPYSFLYDGVYNAAGWVNNCPWNDGAGSGCSGTSDSSGFMYPWIADESFAADYITANHESIEYTTYTPTASGTMYLTADVFLQGFAKIVLFGLVDSASLNIRVSLWVWDTTAGTIVKNYVVWSYSGSSGTTTFSESVQLPQSPSSQYYAPVTAGHTYEIGVKFYADISYTVVIGFGEVKVDFAQNLQNYLRVNSISMQVPIPDPNIVFYTNPTSGTITFNGLTYSNGQSVTLSSGTFTAVANIPSGYAFTGWAGTGGVTPNNPASTSTSVTVTGSGSLTLYMASTSGGGGGGGGNCYSKGPCPNRPQP